MDVADEAAPPPEFGQHEQWPARARERSRGWRFVRSCRQHGRERSQFPRSASASPEPTRAGLAESGLTQLLPSLSETVWVGVSAGSMVMSPQSGVVSAAAPDDRTLGVVEISIFPHLDYPVWPGNTLAKTRSGPPRSTDHRWRSMIKPLSPPSPSSTTPSRSSPRAVGHNSPTQLNIRRWGSRFGAALGCRTGVSWSRLRVRCGDTGTVRAGGSWPTDSPPTTCRAPCSA